MLKYNQFFIFNFSIIPVQHSPPAKNTRYQRNTAAITPTARIPLDCTPSFHQLSENLDRGPSMEGAAPSRRKGMKSKRSRSSSGLLSGYPGMSKGARAILGEVEDEEGEESVLLKIMEQMATIMGQLSQEEPPRDNSKTPAFKTTSIKAPNYFDGTQAHTLREFIQSCQFIFHKDPANFFSDREKVLYSTSFLTDRAGKWIEPHLSNICKEDPSYLLKNLQLFETQLFTLFGYPNEVRKAEKESENLGMKESGHVSFYIADFGSLMSRIGDWGEISYIDVYRRGLESRPLDQLAS
ncbi:hypothetical protein O181_079525 [Austropuccinia psidii MF-1]|uniref:Retrotransposon gag domain-containing protein n=1 Tax=Austropuccinia psidii MF-1 TaxID=1389203 RepID=A0A9Q3FLJ8_9BASI|nr:hypothetical protein [Austropuccinia psidii MF-1]